jgi:adenosylcobinamide-GDP ribazoletransferase
MQYEATAMHDEGNLPLDEEAEHAPLPRPRDFLAALGTLTALPLPRPNPGSEAFGRAAVFFPLVGLLIGAVLVGVHGVTTDHLPQWWVAVSVVGIWEALTAAALLRAHRAHATRGLTVIGAAMVIKILCTTVVAVRPAALLFAPLLARWALVVLATGVRDAAAPRRKFNPAITFREFALASVFSFAAVFAVADALGILLVVSVAALTLGLRLLVHRWVGGVSWHFLLACVEGIEAFVLVVCALL